MKDKIKEIKKGCGTSLNYSTCGAFNTKKGFEKTRSLCPKCKAELRGRIEQRQETIAEVKKMVGYMALVINALTTFKFKCYEQAEKGITMDWLMNNAPCNISSFRIMCKILKEYYPEIYQENGKSISQMEEELKNKLNEMEKQK